MANKGLAAMTFHSQTRSYLEKDQVITFKSSSCQMLKHSGDHNLPSFEGGRVSGPPALEPPSAGPAITLHLRGSQQLSDPTARPSIFKIAGLRDALITLRLRASQLLRPPRITLCLPPFTALSFSPFLLSPVSSTPSLRP